MEEINSVPNKQVESDQAILSVNQSSHFPSKIILIAVVILCLGIFLFIGNYLFLKSRPSNLQTVNNANVSDNIKKSLLKSDNVSFVTLGVALDFIPVEKISNSYGFHSYNLTFYGVKLGTDQLPKVATTVLPKDKSITGSSQSGISLDSPFWWAYVLTSSRVVVVKDGYACYAPVNNSSICSPDGKCLPVDLTFKCTNVIDSKNNTKEKVSQFIYDSLAQMGINCNNENCPVEQSEGNLSIPQFSRTDIYFQELFPGNDSTFIPLVDNDVQKSMNFFSEVGWKTSLIDSTKQEISFSGSDRVIYSKTIQASNLTFSCTHEITVWERAKIIQKRQMIDCWVNLP